MYFISQSGQSDCAFACLCMMLANYHHDRNYLFLPHEDRPYNYREIISEAGKYNLKLLGIRIANYDELQKNSKYPLVVSINLKNGARHSVLLLKAGKKHVLYYDPANGKKKEIVESFVEKWTYYAIIVDKVEKTICPFAPPDFIARRDKVTLPLFQTLSGISLLVGTYFIDRNAYIFVPILAFSSFVVFEILFRQNLINAMRRMDNLINEYQIKLGKKTYFSFYETVEKYRYKSLSFFPNIVYSILIITFMVFILIMNSYYNFVYIIISASLSLLETLVFQPFYKNKSELISESENEIKQAQDDYEYQFFAKEARERAYQLGLAKTIFTYLSIAMLLIVTILVMAFSHIVNITYVVFFLCISIFLKNEFSKVFSFSTTSGDYDSLKNKVVQSIRIE